VSLEISQNYGELGAEDG